MSHKLALGYFLEPFYNQHNSAVAKSEALASQKTPHGDGHHSFVMLRVTDTYLDTSVSPILPQGGLSLNNHVPWL